jgi:hypothetical protein
MNITDLCFKLIIIKDDREYHYANYGKFIVIMIKSEDYTNGFVNATKLCQLGNKNYFHWLELKKSKELIKFYETKFGTRDHDDQIKFVFESKGTDKIDLKLSGTYVHKQLILNISLWISNEFYDKVSNIIENHLIKNFKDDLSLNKNKLEELNVEIEKYNKLIEDKNNCISTLEDSNKDLTNTNKDLNENLKNLNINLEKVNNDKSLLSHKIETIKPKIITDPLNDHVYNILVLFKIDTNKYYISRIQYRNYRQTLKFIYKKYPNNEEILYLDRVPNSNYIFNRLKEEQRELGIEIKNNIIDIINGTEDDLTFRLNELYNEKDF